MGYCVSIARVEKNVEHAIERAIALLGWSPKESTYLIKPNMLNAKTSEEGVTTDPRIIGAIARYLKERGITALVGDSPGNAYPGKARMVFEKTGMMEAIRKYGASYVDFEETPANLVRINGEVVTSIGLGSPIMKSSIINVAKLKTHMQTMMTGAIKNIAMGSIQGSGKSLIHEVGKDPTKMAKAIVDIYEFLRPKIALNVMDAIVCMEGNGPSSGSPIRLGLVMASQDALALDMASFRVAGVDPLVIPYIKEASRRGLGPRLPDEIELLGDAPVPAKFRLPSTIASRLTTFAGAMAYSVLKSSVSFDKSRCTKCGECKGICPTKAISMSPFPTVDRKKCITCYSCHEVCEHNAVIIKKSVLG